MDGLLWWIAAAVSVSLSLFWTWVFSRNRDDE
jgi:hypothetical protein